MIRRNRFDEIYNSPSFRLASIDNIPEFPYTVDIELTNHCNLQCNFCSQNIMTRKKGYISKYDFVRVLNECVKYKSGIRFIRWGEPLLHPHVLDFSWQVKNSGLPLHITTNGLLLTKEHMNNFINMGLDSIIFSMQGSTKEEYEFMRDNKGYDILTYNIYKLVELREDKEKPFIKITSTMTNNDSEEDIAKFKLFWSNIVDEVSIGKTNFARLNKEIPDNTKYVPCKEIFQKLSIDWDGKVTPCCGDYDNYLTIGRVDEGLYNLWNNSDKLKCIRMFLNDMQHRCLTLCSGCYLAYGNFSDNYGKKR